MDHTPTPPQWMALGLLIIAAAALRLAYIDRPIYTDEAYTYLYFIQDGLADVLTDYREPNNHIFQTILAWTAVQVGGPFPAVMRLPALISGLLLIPAAYAAAARLYNRRAGLYAAALIAVNVPLAEYAISARGYSFIALFTALLIILAHDLKARGGGGRWAAYGVVTALGLYTVPTMLYPLGGVSLWLLLSIWREHNGSTRWQLIREMALTLTSAAVATLILYTPILLLNGVTSLTGNPFVVSMTAAEFGGALARVPADFAVFVGQGGAVARVVMFVAFGLAGLSLVFHRRLSADAVPLLLPVLAWTLLLVTVQFVVPPVRVWIHLVVLLALTAGAGLDLVAARVTTAGWAAPLIAGVLVGVVGASVIASDALNNTLTYRREADAEAVATYLAPRFTDGDRVLLTNGALHNYEFYLDAHGLPWQAIALTYPREVALAVATEDTLYVLTRADDRYVPDRLREAVRLDLNADSVRLEPLETMPAGEIIVNRLVVTNAN